MKQFAEYIIPIILDGKNCMPDFLQAKELIRCRDCKYNPKTSYTGCPMAAVSGRTETDYCSRAERKETS